MAGPRIVAVIPALDEEESIGAVVRAMDMDPADVVRFRYRGEGWPGLARAESTDGRIATLSYNDSWGGYLSKAVQFRCKLCPDGVGGAADVACADAWYGDAHILHGVNIAA